MLFRSAVLGDRLLTGLKTLEALDGVGDVRGKGMMAAVELVADKTTKQPYPTEANVGARVYQEMLKRGLFTRVLGDMILLAPPLVSTEEQIDQIVAIIGESVQTVIAGVGG